MSLSGFNSTLVQLKVTTQKIGDGQVTKFQFYLSSIKSPEQKFTSLRLKGFNSTLVQLKDYASAFEGLEGNCFNSTLVQLKVDSLSTQVRST